ncbi:MAG: hypothetical protein R6U27_09520 [Desulfobacterales bacterium]
MLLHSQTVVFKAEKTATQARLEMHREETGLDRTAGKGKRYDDAKIRFEEAIHQVARAEQDIEHARLRLGEVETRIGGINARLNDSVKS